MPAGGAEGRQNLDPGGATSFVKRAKFYQPANTAMEPPAATVSRYSLQLINRATGEAYSADELADGEKLVKHGLTTAPVNATPSRLQIGPVNSGIEILSQVFGASRNGTTVQFVQGVGVSVPASAAYAAGVITVTLPTNGSGAAQNLNYGEMSSVITDDLRGDWVAISTGGTVATAGVKGVTSGGTDGTPAAGPSSQLYANPSDGSLFVPAVAQDIEGSGWKNFGGGRRISGNIKVSFSEGAGDFRNMLAGFPLSEEETVAGTLLQITGTITFVRVSEVTPAVFLTIGFSPQYQHAQERCGVICTGLASGVIHLASEILISTDGGSDTIYHWKMDASREPQGILIDPTPAMIALDINGTGYWEDNMTTREAPVGFAHDLEFGLFYGGPCEAEYLIGYDLSLTVVTP